MYNHCKECKGKKECNQPLVGFVNGVRCRFNQRGTYNTTELLKSKYERFSCDNVQEIIQHINTYHSIYLWGPYGLGKTHETYWLANKYNLQGHDVFVILAADIREQLIKEIQLNKSTGEIPHSIRQTMKDVELLFIDDVGNEQMTDFVHDCVQSVIDYRYRNELPTFITSNYPIPELYKTYTNQIGEYKAGQIVSRMKKFGVVEIKGKNWRNE